MKRFIAIFIYLVFSATAFSQSVQVPSVKCEGMRGQFVLTIVDQKLKVQNDVQRIPASVPTLINRLRGESLIQVTYLQGERHKIFIENIYDLENSSNTLSKRSKRGHEMTYPLDCQKID